MLQSYAVINGATGGMGSAIAQQLAQRFNLILLGRNEKSLQQLSEQIKKSSPEIIVHYFLVDMLKPDTLLAAANTIQKMGCLVKSLVNCVGVVPVGGVMEIEERQWHDTFQIAFMSAVNLIKYFSPMMQEKGGSVVIINGVFAIQPDANFVASAAVTGALRNFAKAISKDLIRYRIRVNSLLPGGTQTPLWDDIAIDLGKKLNISAEHLSQSAAASNPLKRLAEPNDIAQAVNFLCSDEASYINGAFLTIDGGASLAM
ncbi:MAG: SDR family oxidoreductase [Gammaproteobacteria bacterium]|nr:SDR family oxidoreductase [Gammaproteobacteria bacterium]